MLWALALSAQKRGVFASMASYARAASEQQAYELGLAAARGKFNARDGWTNHNVSVAEIQQDWIIEEARVIDQRVS